MGRRIGGSKAVVDLHGRPLISYPLAAMQAAVPDVAVIAKAETELPPLSGVTVWIEREAMSHPLIGLVEALGLARGRPVLACPVDLPFVTPDMLSALARAPRGGAAAVIARCEGELQPLLGCFAPAAAAQLAAAARAERPVRQAIEALAPRYYEVADRASLFNINSPSDLLTARATLDAMGPPNRT